MREKKFQVYHKLNDGHWYLYHVDALKTNSRGTVDTVFIGVDEGTKLDKDTILVEYINLNDKNKKEIYEGDIVINKAVEKYGKNPAIPFVVEYHDGGFCFCRDDKKVFSKKHRPTEFANLSNWEVIGNIYMNPEILGGTK
jgi:uncharacterized phage protein (TIGR01671 family)